ncbi:hypothetical protein DH2020_019166 [Rehmannia glutinosa]|uniref:Protein kinase domain-containing protein n=1 Tax=Rehmannia glutinosa TaxID=99300 RepID=A0ABR0WMD6_REHGL
MIDKMGTRIVLIFPPLAPSIHSQPEIFNNKERLPAFKNFNLQTPPPLPPSPPPPPPPAAAGNILQMAATPLKSHFSLLSCFILSFLVQSRAQTLLPSDFNALLLIQKDFGLRRAPARNPCDSAGIFCERRIANNSYVLRITRLVFESQHLNGRISPAIGKLSELKELSLPHNQLVDQIPAQIVDLQKLEILNLGNNRFSGEIPSGLSWLIRLRVLDLSANKFTGTLKFLKHFPNLEKLNLADNMFAGKIPVSLRSFRNLRFINMSANCLLEGSLTLMNNHLDQLLSSDFDEKEKVPKRYVFAETTQTTSSAVAPASSQSSNVAAPSPSPTAAAPHDHRKENKKKKIMGWILGFLAGTLGGCLSGFVFSFLFRMIMFLISGHSNNTSLKIFSPLIKKPEDLAFLEKEDGLASLDVIGRGGCGEVYRAVLPESNGKEIAIKKIIQPPRDADELTEEDSKLLNKKMRQIKSEIQTYMKNGSLQDYLQHVKEGRTELDWLARYKIALGVSAGLEYLHMNHTPRIIHRDLKPANILLDDEMEARVRISVLQKQSLMLIRTLQLRMWRGRWIYRTGVLSAFKFTDKCDVYSFGVVLGALIMGKLPSDEFFQHTDEIGLVKWMRNVMVSDDRKKGYRHEFTGEWIELKGAILGGFRETTTSIMLARELGDFIIRNLESRQGFIVDTEDSSVVQGDSGDRISEIIMYRVNFLNNDQVPHQRIHKMYDLIDCTTDIEGDSLD